MAKVHLITSPVAGSRYKKKNTFTKKIATIVSRLFKIGKGISALIIFVMFVYFIWILMDDPRYKIKEIQINGLKIFSETEVRKNVDVFLGSGMVRLKTEEIKRKLQQIPFIEDCSVEKDYEGNRIIINIQELPPYATLFVDDQMFLISHTGKILKRISNITEAKEPLITGVSRRNVFEPGAYINDEGLWSALEFWYEYNQVPKNKNIKISEIVIDSNENLKVYFDEIPCETRWKRENLKRQVQNFSIALNKVDITRVQCNEYIDMRFNDDIIYK